MTTPTVTLRASIDGGPPQTGGVEVPAGATVQFSFADTSGWEKYRISIVGPPAWTTPAGWETGEGGVVYYDGTIELPPAITLPGTEAWGKYMPTLVVNDAKRNEAFDKSLIDRRTALSMLSAYGLADVGVGESSQFGDVLRGWLRPIQEALRQLDARVANGLVSSFSYSSVDDADAALSVYGPELYVFVKNLSASRVLSLPSSASSDGQIIHVKTDETCSGATTVTLDPGADSIDGASSYVLDTAWSHVRLLATSWSGWQIV